MNELETDAQKVLQMEAEAILDLIPRVDEHFDAAVDMILSCEGRVIMTGMGKSGIIAHKISAWESPASSPIRFPRPWPAPAPLPFICTRQKGSMGIWAWLRQMT